MNPGNFRKIILGALPLMILAMLCVPAGAQSQMYTMTGKIAAIDLEHDTVVVEVPVKDDQMLTVGGPLVSDARIRKGGQSTDLDQFNIGESVAVTWQKTDETLLIHGLNEAR